MSCHTRWSRLDGGALLFYWTSVAISQQAVCLQPFLLLPTPLLVVWVSIYTCAPRPWFPGSG